MSSYLKPLEHLRFFAAMMVVLYHFRQAPSALQMQFSPSLLNALFFEGATGVSFFITLTGFLFASIYYNKSINYRDFLVKRAYRILPLYVSAYLLFSAVARGQVDALATLQYLLFQTNVGTDIGGYAFDIAPLGPLWTISLEVQFYLAFPLVIYVAKGSAIRTLGAIVFMAICMRFLVVGYVGPERAVSGIYHTMIGRADQFAIGMLGGVLCFHHKSSLLDQKKLSAAALGAAAIVALFGLLLFFHDKSPVAWVLLKPSLEAGLWLILIVSYLTLLRSNREGPIAKSLGWLGKISYSTYVFHWAVIITVDRYVPWLSLVPDSALNVLLNFTMFYIGPIISFSAMSFYAVERPFLLLKGDRRVLNQAASIDADQFQREDTK